MQKEVFGPVVSITRFAEPEEAVTWANDSPYGLASSEDTRHQKGHVGGAPPPVWLDLINTHFVLTNEMPHDGMKMAGYGEDLSVHGL